MPSAPRPFLAPLAPAGGALEGFEGLATGFLVGSSDGVGRPLKSSLVTRACWPMRTMLDTTK